MNVGSKIRELRIEKGIRQADLAKILNVDKTTVTKWETNCHLPDFEKLVAIADYFDVSTDFLLGRKDY